MKLSTTATLHHKSFCLDKIEKKLASKPCVSTKRTTSLPKKNKISKTSEKGENAIA